MAAIRQPQLYSAWGRNQAARIKQDLGPRWNTELPAATSDRALAIGDRLRALDLMQLVGPFPEPRQLVLLSQDEAPAMRAKAAYLMGVHADDAIAKRLVDMLADPEPLVRRTACESLVRAGLALPVNQIIALLADPDRHVAWSARRALEILPTDHWQSAVLQSENIRVFLQGSVALLVVDTSRSAVDSILNRATRALREQITDEDFIDLLRVVQLALYRGNVSGDDVPVLRRLLAEDYPSLEPRMNRELLRLLVYLQEPTIVPRMLAELRNEEIPFVERLHAASHARFLNSGWTPDRRVELLQFYELAREATGGHSFAGYIENLTRDVVASLSSEEQIEVLYHGLEIPAAALYALAALPESPETTLMTYLEQLDRQLRQQGTEACDKLSTGIVAIFARSGDARAMAYLREVFENDPDRRQEVAMGLAQDPGGENWPLLLQSLPVLEGPAAQEVLMKLVTVDQQPDKPEPIRQVILRGLKLGKDGGQHAVALLEKWTAQSLSQPDDSWDVALGAWQQWFRESFPNEPHPELPVAAEDSRWTYDELLKHLYEGDGVSGDAERGALVFDKAQCVKCHRYGQRGEGIGPDLSSVSRRFQRKEILQSVLFPSHVISDQYAAKTLITTEGKTVTGIVAPSGEDAWVVLQANGEKLRVAKQDVEEMAPSQKSAMPEGLFDNLTAEEIADLFAYLSTPVGAN